MLCDSRRHAFCLLIAWFPYNLSSYRGDNSSNNNFRCCLPKRSYDKRFVDFFQKFQLEHWKWNNDLTSTLVVCLHCSLVFIFILVVSNNIIICDIVRNRLWWSCKLSSPWKQRQVCHATLVRMLYGHTRFDGALIMWLYRHSVWDLIFSELVRHQQLNIHRANALWSETYFL